MKDLALANTGWGLPGLARGRRTRSGPRQLADPALLLAVSVACHRESVGDVALRRMLLLLPLLLLLMMMGMVWVVVHPLVEDRRATFAAAALASPRGGHTWTSMPPLRRGRLLLQSGFLGAPLLEAPDGRAADAVLSGEVGLLLAAADALEDREPLVLVQVPRRAQRLALGPRVVLVPRRGSGRGLARVAAVALRCSRERQHGRLRRRRRGGRHGRPDRRAEVAP